MIFQELKGLTRICTDDTDFEAGNKNEDGYQDLFSFIGQRQVLPVIASLGAVSAEMGLFQNGTWRLVRVLWGLGGGGVLYWESPVCDRDGG
jgi:hypothetical protein